MQQIVSHSYWICNEDRLTITASLHACRTYYSLPQALSFCWLLTLIKKTQYPKICIVNFSCVIKRSLQPRRSHFFPFFQTCGITGFCFMCDAVYARARSVEMLWCDSLLFICLSAETRAFICEHKDVLQTCICQGTMSILVERGKEEEQHVCMPSSYWSICSDCERPLPLLGNIIHQGGLQPDTGEDCLYTLPLYLWTISLSVLE